LTAATHRTRTTARWAARVLADPIALLDDHAHLEKKAASNALDLLNRSAGGEPGLPAEWTRVLAAIARDEVDHLGAVLRMLHARGGRMSRMHRNPYASSLRRLVRAGGGPDELVDRLLVSALIEARSCERFEVLAQEASDAELRRLYRGLEASERGHHRQFLALAEEVGGERASRRWEVLLDAEARTLAAQASGPGMHSGDAEARPMG
jgi:tRNA-(ms[2]io[6]A)-hydroxylase